MVGNWEHMYSNRSSGFEKYFVFTAYVVPGTCVVGRVKLNRSDLSDAGSML
jgi:hypothetical protein